MKCQMDYMESIKKLEEKWMFNHQKHTTNGCIGSSYTKEVSISLNMYFQGISTKYLLGLNIYIISISKRQVVMINLKSNCDKRILNFS